MHFKSTDFIISSAVPFTLFYIALCLDPVDIDFGTVTLTGNSIGDTATYSCNPGFELIGGATTTCTQMDPNSAGFSPLLPSCRREHMQ